MRGRLHTIGRVLLAVAIGLLCIVAGEGASFAVGWQGDASGGYWLELASSASVVGVDGYTLPACSYADCELVGVTPGDDDLSSASWEVDCTFDRAGATVGCGVGQITAGTYDLFAFVWDNNAAIASPSWSPDIGPLTGGVSDGGSSSTDPLAGHADDIFTLLGDDMHHPVAWGVFMVAGVGIAMGLVLKWTRRAVGA
jgi:hypothetical protein